MMDLKIVVDTTSRLVVQTTSDQLGEWVIASVVFGVIAFAATRLWRRARGLAIGALSVVGLLFVWTALSLLRTGGVVDEFVMDRAANQFTVDSFFPRTHLPESQPIARPLDAVLRCDVEQTRNGSTLIVTLKSGDRVYPLGHAARHNSNEFQVLDRMRRLIGQAP